MNICELILFIWTTVLTIYFIDFVINMLDKIKKHDKDLDNIFSYIKHDLDPQIENIRQLVSDEIINKKNKNYSDEADKKIGVGKWIKFSSDGTYGVCDWYGCSICHNSAPKDQYCIDYLSPYCPTCGAKMEGKE